MGVKSAKSYLIYLQLFLVEYVNDEKRKGKGQAQVEPP